MIRSATIFTAALFACFIATAADAHQRAAQSQRARAGQEPIICNERGCSDYGQVRSQTANRSQTPARSRAHVIDANGNTVVVGGRPAGCPHRFCGCEASLYVFGKIRPELNLAANWIRKFPRTSPAPGMVAARPGHVMVLMSHVGGNDWLVHDGNSGGGLTRRHVRSTKGYVIVDPHATRAAEHSPRPQRDARGPTTAAAAAPSLPVLTGSY